jgi:hypothetical protein
MLSKVLLKHDARFQSQGQWRDFCRGLVEKTVVSFDATMLSLAEVPVMTFANGRRNHR